MEHGDGPRVPFFLTTEPEIRSLVPEVKIKTDLGKDPWLSPWLVIFINGGDDGGVPMIQPSLDTKWNCHADGQTFLIES